MGFHTIWTIALLTIFVLIVFWAFSSLPKDDFREAASIPLDSDDSDVINPPADIKPREQKQ